MAKKRQSFSKDFKAKVTLEALREESTIQEIAVKHGFHPNQISQWKAQAIAGMADFFERPNKKSEETRKQEEEKDFNLLVKIKEVQIEHPYYGYRRIWRVFNTMDALQYASLLQLLQHSEVSSVAGLQHT